MKRTTKDTTTTDEQVLATAAARGDQVAFEELHRRHAPLAWRLALAVTADPDLAARAVTQATGTVFTAVRAGRFQSQPHGTALATAARGAALDLRRGTATGSPVVADDADPLLAGAFAALPERWRSVLWLRDGEGLAATQTAPIVELDVDAVDQLAVRARRGLRERYLRAQVACAGSRDCSRATSRLGALDDGTLAAGDAATLQGHLQGCASCAEVRSRVGTLASALPALALPPADGVHDQAAAAWSAALASSTHTGLAPRTEKILAAVSAFAAVAGILGATALGSNASSETVASPLAPLVADIDTPKPVDLASLTLPITTPDPITSDARRSSSPTTWAAERGGAADVGGGAGAGEVASPGGGTTPGGGDAGPGDAPASTTPAAPQPDPVVGIDPDRGVSVGPLNVDLTPGDGGGIVNVETPRPLAPVVDPVLDTANDALRPVVGALEPVTRPLLETTQSITKPITDTLDGALGGLGLGELRGLGGR